MKSLRSKMNAIVVGSGPNGFASAITLASAGYPVRLYEAAHTIGGGMRTAELTQPGFLHDVCSTIHALGVASPFFKTVPLKEEGLEWVTPPAPLAHPLEDGTAVILERSVDKTANALGIDGAAYQKLMSPFVSRSEFLLEETLGPLHFPRHPFLLARFGMQGMQSAWGISHRIFRGARARALFAGLAAHAVLPLESSLTAAFGIILGLLGHTHGWPIVRGGSQKLADALASHFKKLGGEIVTGMEIRSLQELPSAAVTLLDVTPRQWIRIAGEKLPVSYKKKLQQYRYGPGIFKMDLALKEPIPWKAKECSRAATVHLGGNIEEIAESERAVWNGQHPERPFVLLAQPTLFDSTRAPAGRHVAWAYCHVPNGSTVDMSSRIESQIERFAPGFRDQIIARSVRTTRQMEEYNSNYIGGDINGGVQDLRQLFARPMSLWNPYATPMKGIYLCSSSTPPGGGVHGMCGYHAARAALRLFFSHKLRTKG